jgi:excisionase family DNA binding protein
MLSYSDWITVNSCVFCMSEGKVHTDEPARQREPMGVGSHRRAYRESLQHLKAQGKRYCHTVYDNPEAIALMHELRTAGYSYEAIAQHLNAAGIPTAQGALAIHGGLGHCQAHPAQDSEEDCMKVEDRLFSIAEVAERLGMSKDTIHNWIKAGRLKASRIGRFWRIRERDLEAFIDNPPPLHPGASAQKEKDGTSAAEG